MTYKLFYHLYFEAFEHKSLDVYISDCLNSPITKYYGDNLSKLEKDIVQNNKALCNDDHKGQMKWIEDLTNIYTIAHMPVVEMRKKLGLTQLEFAYRFAFKLKTVVKWESKGVNYRPCPPDKRLMLAELIGLIKVKREG